MIRGRWRNENRSVQKVHENLNEPTDKEARGLERIFLFRSKQFEEDEK